MLHQRHYTTAEANAAVPRVRELVRRLQVAKRTLTAEGFDSGFVALTEVSGGAYAGRTRAEAVVGAALGFEELERLEVVVRDLEAGLIDFPALRDDREVYLCWHVDEAAVGHWHSPEAGYAGRLPLDRPL